MDNWDYRNKFVSESWIVPTTAGAEDAGRKVEAGFWIRETIDRPVKYQQSDRFPNSGSLNLWKPLRHCETRILSLNPGPPNAPLAGRFDTIHLGNESSHDDYEALSYVWGSAESGSVLHVQTGTGSEEVGLTNNVTIALMHLRSTTQRRRLWIDAVCINQKDLVERSEQVQLMTMIYRKACNVRVWLGMETEHSALGMMILDDMSKGNFIDGNSSYFNHPPELLCAALQDILHRPYFGRLWVVQEAALAQNTSMSCGNHTISWPSTATAVVKFIRALKLAAVSPTWRDVGLQDVNPDGFLQLLDRQLASGPDAKRWASRQRKPDMLSSAYTLRNRNVTDPRDRFYSLLGLVDAQTAKELQPDYTLPVDDSFTRFVAVMNMQTAELCVDLDGISLEERADSKVSKMAAQVESAKNNIELEVDEDLSFQTSAESECLKALQHIRQGEIEKAQRVLGRVSMLLNSGMERAIPSAAVER